MRTVHNLSRNKNLRKQLRNTATIHEQILWARLRGNQLGVKFRRQHSIGKYIADFYCPEKKLIIELDGGQHFSKKEYDDERTKYFEGLGMKVLRFWDSEVNINIEGVVLGIVQELQRR